MKCDELKAKHVVDVYDEYSSNPYNEAQVYLKSEADKVIADLEESHKKEVGQLLMEIVKLKEKRDTAEKLLNKALYCVSNGKNHMMSLARKNNHANYKRCLAMAQEWRNYATFCGMQSSCHNHRGFGKTAEKYNWKEFHAWKCVKRWIAISEKFKQNSTAQHGKDEVK